jgi:hypothetical protein
MAHGLELAVKNAVDTVNVASQFRIFMDELYKVYSMSPQNLAELQAVADSFAIEILKVKKVFDIRWVFSSYVAVRSVLHDYAALNQHFVNNCSQESARTSKEKCKYKGLIKKLNSWIFVDETCLLKDGLRCLKQLSLYLQNNDSNIIHAMDHVDNL